MYIIPRAIVPFIMLFLLTVGYGSEIAGKIPDEINKKNVQDKWFAIDKVQHFSYSCLIALGSQYVLVNKGGMEEDSALPLSAGFSLFTGILKEILKKTNGNILKAIFWNKIKRIFQVIEFC